MTVHDLTDTLLKKYNHPFVVGYLEGFADNLMARLKYENPDLYAEMVDNIKCRVEKYNGTS